MSVVGKTENSGVSFDSPEISQDDDGDHQWSQRDGVPHCVDKIQTMKDLLWEQDNSLECQRESKKYKLEDYSRWMHWSFNLIFCVLLLMLLVLYYTWQTVLVCSQPTQRIGFGNHQLRQWKDSSSESCVLISNRWTTVQSLYLDVFLQI